MFKHKELLDKAAMVERQTGRSRARQLLDIVGLKRRNPTLGATDYYCFRLYDPAFLRDCEPWEFAGWRLDTEVSYALNPRDAATPGWNKLRFAETARLHGLPAPEIVAVYQPRASRRFPSPWITLRSADDVRRFLGENGSWPLFAKPAMSLLGRGGVRMESYVAAADELVLHDGGRVGLNDFVARFMEGALARSHQHEAGFLFQKKLVPHPQLVELTGNTATSGVRIVVLSEPDGARAFRALWKVATGNNIVDNFRHGTLGNVLAEVDVQSGRVGRVLTGFWPNGTMVADHPLSGLRLEGSVLPHWREAVELVCEAAPIFTRMRIQHWDVAITESGPCLIELNDIGALDFHQLHGRGLLDGEMRRFLKRFGDPGRIKWLSKVAP